MARIPDRLSPAARDALALLAHVYLRFNHADAAAALLAALAEIDVNPTWARRALCLARLQAGHNEAALAEAEALLANGGADDGRLPLLHIAAQASWRLGRPEAARVWREAAQGASVLSVLPGSGLP
jgi:hypothetical protein